jgi:flavorubredoxin
VSVGVPPVSTAPREIADGVWWLPECVVIPLSGAPTHVHVSPYLIVGSEKSLLWDVASPQQWPNIERSLDSLLGERPLDYLVPSHPEVAHCGNVPRVMEKYPGVQLVGDVRDYPFFFPQLARRMVSLPVGTEIDLGSHSFTLVDAVLKDLPSTQWGYESSQRVLFVSDGFAYSHRPPLEGDDRPTHAPGECSLFAGELDAAPAPEQIVWITKAALYWTHFVKLDLFLEWFEDVLREHPADFVAPAHGAVIDDVDGVLWTIWEALRLSYDPSRGARKAGSYIAAPTRSS